MFNQNFRESPKIQGPITEFNISAIHLAISLSDSINVHETHSLIGPINNSETITIVDTLTPFSGSGPSVIGIIFRSPFRFVSFRSPKRDVTKPTAKRIDFKTYPRKLSFRSIKRIDP